MKLTRWVLVVVLAACSSPGANWDKAGATQDTVSADSSECRAKARMEAPQPHVFAATGGQVYPTLTVEEKREQSELEYFQKCMREKGYSAKR